MEKICILGANFSTGNMGVGALLMGALKALGHGDPDAQFFILDYSVQPERTQCRINRTVLEVPLVNIRFSKKIYLPNHIARLLFMAFLTRVLPSRRLRDFIIKRHECLRRLSDTDRVASLAGGDSFSDIYGLGRLVYVALPQLLAILMNKPLVMMPQTLGPFKGFFARAIAKFLMRHARDILSRDQAGLTETRALLGRGATGARLRFCHDIGFLLDPERPVHSDLSVIERARNSGHWICGINLSGLLWMGGYSRNNMFELKTDYRKLMRECIQFMLARNNSLVVLVPHVFGESAESDTHAIRLAMEPFLAYHSQRLFTPSGTFNQNEIKHIIGRCDFFVGARMHACIAALSQCIPTISVAYSGKFIGVMKSIGMESNCVDPRTQNSSEITSRISTALNRAADTKAVLQRTIPQVRQSILDMFASPSSPLNERPPHEFL